MGWYIVSLDIFLNKNKLYIFQVYKSDMQGKKNKE